jgi:hypothetical protein
VDHAVGDLFSHAPGRYLRGVRFCPWYPLAEAAGHAPAGEGVLQLRVAEGLLDYPTGKSAMVHYEHARDVRTAALALAAAHADRALWCRHLDLEGEREVDLVAFHARVLGEFVRRFGCAPSFEYAT